MSVKFGVKQANSPAPRGYRNFRRAWNIALAPSVAGAITGWGIQNPVYESRALLVLALVTALVNAIDILLGSDDVIVNEGSVVKE